MDLHDGVMQSLYGVGLLLEDVAERLDEEPEQSKRQLWRSIDRLNASIADLRGYVIGLRPVEAANQPLGESLAMLAEHARSNALLTGGSHRSGVRRGWTALAAKLPLHRGRCLGTSPSRADSSVLHSRGRGTSC